MSAEINVGLISSKMGTITEIKLLGIIRQRSVLPVPGSKDELKVDCSNPDATLLQRIHHDGRSPEPPRIINEENEKVLFGETQNGNRRLIIINHKP